jgi:uncharacterized protein
MVLLPGMPLPLHIFEDRYRQMVADIAETPPAAFGVVTLTRGAPSDTDVSVADVGTVAEVVESEPYPDGRVDLLTVGTRRFRVLEVDAQTRPYLCAQVQWLAEEFGAVDANLLGQVRRSCRIYLARLAALGLRAENDLSHDPLKLSYEVAARLQLPMEERLELLRGPTVADRLRAELDLLAREVALLGATRAIPVPPQALRSVLGAS